MAKSSKKSRRKEPSEPAVESAPRVTPRRATADRRLRILESLTSGLSVARIARAENLTIRRVRQMIAQMLENREVDPPAGFVQLQIARLGEAMIVAHTMMMEGDLQAMDRMIKLTSELDRYHGFARAAIPAASEAAPPPRIAAPKPKLLAGYSTPDRAKGKFSASQDIENAENPEIIASAR